MQAYSILANVYDELMDETPYEAWTNNIINYLRKYNVNDGIVADLGCGTGIVTKAMACAGYDMIGIDNSEEMLGIANEKSSDAPLHILYLLQDMTEFELYGTVRAIYSVCDSINYILEDAELVKVFKLVKNYMEDDGVFIFDFNTIYKYREIIGDSTIAENREDCSFIWENYFDEESGINEYDLTIFLKEGSVYSKHCETHFQRGYSVDKMISLVEDAGLKVLEMSDVDNMEDITNVSERVYFVVGK